MKNPKILLVLLPLLSACTPYVFGGLGYAGESGEYGFNERGMLGTYGAGIEFNRHLSCEYRHRSMVDRRPEVVTNDLLCQGRVYFGERK